MEDPGNFCAVDLCENWHKLNRLSRGAGNDLLKDCLASAAKLCRPEVLNGRQCYNGASTIEIVNSAAEALREAAAVADNHWNRIWRESANLPKPANSPKVSEGVETEIDEAIKRTLKKRLRAACRPEPYWVSRKPDHTRLPEKEGLVFIADFGGKRNFRSRLPLYAISLGAAWVTNDIGTLRFHPVCAGIYAPCFRHLYLGIPGEGGGAVLIDEREEVFEVHKLTGAVPSSNLTVCIHHSRSEKFRSRMFVDEISRLLPPSVDKVLALASGPLSLALTTAGLAAYFESGADCCTTYPAAIILQSATGKKTAVTDFDGAPWIEGNPLKKRGVLAWGSESLQKQIEDDVLEVCAALPARRN